ncbi:hypothetical protein CYMTET_53012 [Cymbomonas tetramitiformis]|uniref:Uncharacterized protein n=1 Tax=Cymbomonas tetramitiformis TaxID=36881 RepID=A0AAE0EQS4_9CHLO|nr:hypothetical protein CYMTET_53012 [Cymbomonas tetramitiformis]
MVTQSLYLTARRGGCASDCYQQTTCDYWYEYGYQCNRLEDVYGCDCTGCSCGGASETPTGSPTMLSPTAMPTGPPMTLSPTSATPTGSTTTARPTSGCASDCYQYTCDYWYESGYECNVLEDVYGCDCTGCSCGEAPGPTMTPCTVAPSTSAPIMLPPPPGTDAPSTNAPIMLPPPAPPPPPPTPPNWDDWPSYPLPPKVTEAPTAPPTRAPTSEPTTEPTAPTRPPMTLSPTSATPTGSTTTAHPTSGASSESQSQDMNVVIGIGVTFLLLMVGAVVYVYNKDRIWYTVDRALMQMLKCWVVDAEDLDDPESNVGHAGKDAVFDNPVENAVFCAAGDPDISIEETPDVWDSRQNPTFAHGTHHNAAQEIIRNAVKGGAKLEDSSVTMVQLGEARGGHGSRGEEPFWKALMLSTINQRMQELIDATNTLKCAMIISCITSEAEDKLTTLLQKCSNAIKDMKIASEKSRLGGEQKEAVADAFTEVILLGGPNNSASPPS